MSRFSFSYLPLIPNFANIDFLSGPFLSSASITEPIEVTSNTTHTCSLQSHDLAMAEADKMSRIHGVEAIIGYQFTEYSRIWEALQAAGSPVQVIGNRRIDVGNKRLAVLGDCVLDLALAEAWLQGTGPRGGFDIIRQSVANNVNLERIGHATGLAAFVNLAPGSLGVVPKGPMTATVEAVLGAVYLDSDMDTVKRTMNTLGLVSPWGDL